MAKVQKIQKLESQSIYTTLATRIRTVNILTEGKGENAERWGLEVTIPDWFPADTDLDSEEAIINHLREFGDDLVLCVLQSGLSQELINVWTKPKPKPATKTESGEDIHDEEYPTIAQNRVDEYMPEPMKRPNIGNKKALEQAKLDAGRKMAESMRMAGLSDELILASLVPVYGEDAQSILDAIN